MANLIGNPKDVIHAMKLCNEGKEVEVLKSYNLKPIDGIETDGNFVDKVISVANTTSNINGNVGGILVSNSVKGEDVVDSVEDVVGGVKEFSQDAVSEAAADFVSGVKFLKDFIVFSEESDVIGGVLAGQGSIASDIKTALTPTPPIPEDIVEKSPKEYVENMWINIKEAMADANFKNSEVFKYIQDNWMVAGSLTALGIFACFVAYKMWKTNPSVQTAEVKSVVDQFPKEVTNESAIECLSILKEDENWKDIVSATGTNIVEKVKDVAGQTSDMAGKAIDTVKTVGGAKVADAKEFGDDAVEKATEVTKDFGTNVSEFGEAVVDYIKNIPNMIKGFMETLTGPEGIQGKQMYISLLVGSLVAACGIYVVYKLFKKKSETVQESAFAFISVNLISNKLFKFLKEAEENVASQTEYYNSFITGAVNASDSLFNDDKFKESSMYGFAENCVAKMAAPYDEYLQDISSK